MSGARSVIALTVFALAFGGVAGAVFVAVSGGAPSESTYEPTSSVRTVDAVPDAQRASTSDPSVGDDGAGTTPRSSAGLTQRLDDPSEDVRHALALELLRRGPDALVQARALRPATSAGAEVHNRLVLALDKMRLLRRANDYAKLPEHLRLRLDLDAFASVVPEALLVNERLAYWERELGAVRYRLSRDAAHEAEESLAVLELERARREVGRVAPADYSARAQSLLPGIEAWLADQRQERGASAAAIRDLEQQVERLRP